MSSDRKKYFKLGMGGTFDHFHAGHEKFILFASDLAAHLVIGVTDPQLTRNKPYELLIEPYSIRARAVHQFCNRHHISHSVVRLFDQFGPTLEGSDVRVLAVTPETAKGADKINEVREKLQLQTLPVYICDYFLDEDGKPLHAEQIRAGISNRQGTVYPHIFSKDLSLSDDQRAAFQPAQGEIITQPHESPTESLRIVVGDRSLATFISNAWNYDLGIFDNREQRQETQRPEITQLKPDSTVENPPGKISLQLIKVLQTVLQQKQKYLLVEGEEDLAAVALVLLTPLNTQIYYGQPGEGIVEMVVTEELKETFYNILTKPKLSQNS